MAEFKVDTDRLKGQAEEIRQLQNSLNEVALKLTGFQVGSVLQAKATIPLMAAVSTCKWNAINQSGDLGKMATGLERVAEAYVSTETKLSDNSAEGTGAKTTGNQNGVNLTEWIKSLFKGLAPVEIENCVLGGGLAGLVSSLVSFVDDKEEILSGVKALLNAIEKVGDDDEAGVFKEVIGYIKDFAAFLNGDKTGATGASSYCKLTGSTVSLWTQMADLYRKIAEESNLDFWVTKSDVAGLKLTSSCLGLIASVFSASDDLDSKKWQDIVSDYIGSGKELVSVIAAKYKLDNIANVDSLANSKAGPWSALNIYKAIGVAAVNVVSQTVRSVGEYYADGEWSLADTGATGIDISIAGLYSLGHVLTGGLDDIIYGLVDKANGTDTVTDMSYAEKAAAGYKYLSKVAGEALGKWWLSIRGTSGQTSTWWR